MKFFFGQSWRITFRGNSEVPLSVGRGLRVRKKANSAAYFHAGVRSKTDLTQVRATLAQTSHGIGAKVLLNKIVLHARGCRGSQNLWNRQIATPDFPIRTLGYSRYLIVQRSAWRPIF